MTTMQPLVMRVPTGTWITYLVFYYYFTVKLNASMFICFQERKDSLQRNTVDGLDSLFLFSFPIYRTSSRFHDWSDSLSVKKGALIWLLIHTLERKYFFPQIFPWCFSHTCWHFPVCLKIVDQIHSKLNEASLLVFVDLERQLWSLRTIRLRH
jgi:hypothetical protein